jgi:hypothetical protein
VTRFLKLILCGGLMLALSGWGFFAHRKINRLAVFALPPEMIGFYKKNITYIEEAAVNPDRRRYSDPEEAPRHYIDLDDHGDSATNQLPKYWNQAVEKMTEDSLKSKGILPWHIQRMYFQLKDAFLLRDPARILRVSAELGHYLSDAHVPLHTTSNYDGQKTGQSGIHGFWESRLPELYFSDYDFFVGRATYVEDVQLLAWNIIRKSSDAVDSVLRFERELSKKRNGEKYSFETKSRQTVKVYSVSYSREYHQLLNGMVQRQMRGSIRAISSIWYTAWVDAGQPDLVRLINYQPTEEELKARREEVEKWKEANVKSREHERENDK